MTIFNVTGGSSGGGSGGLTFKEMTSGLYEIKESDWGTDTKIHYYMFYADTNLQKITFPNTITSMSNYSFSNCSSLKEVIMKGTFTSIPQQSFVNCYALEYVEIPASVASMATYAFGNIGTSTAEGATIKELRSTPPSLHTQTFNGASIKKIIVPQGSLSAYQNAYVWSNYASVMEEAS